MVVERGRKDGDVTMKEKRDNDERREERKKRRERKERKGRVERRCREGENTREDEEPTANHGMGRRERERKTREKEADGKQMICLNVSELLFWMRCGEGFARLVTVPYTPGRPFYLQCAGAAYHTLLYC